MDELSEGVTETKFIRMCPKVLHIPWLRDLHNE